MGKKKKGYQQSLGEAQGAGKHNAAKGHHAGTMLPPVDLGAFDESYLKMVVDTAGTSEVGEQIAKIANALLETKSLVTLREDVQSLSLRSQGGGLVGQDSAKDFVCFLLLGPQFHQLKKYSLAVLIHLDAHSVLQTLENILIEFTCSDEFEMRSGNLHQLPDLMRTFEYKLMAYLEIYHKLIEQNVYEEELDEKGEKVLVVDAKKAYDAQVDFLKII